MFPVCQQAFDPVGADFKDAGVAVFAVGDHFGLVAQQ
jgi:hypothetical protein